MTAPSYTQAELDGIERCAREVEEVLARHDMAGFATIVAPHLTIEVSRPCASWTLSMEHPADPATALEKTEGTALVYIGAQQGAEKRAESCARVLAVIAKSFDLETVSKRVDRGGGS